MDAVSRSLEQATDYGAWDVLHSSSGRTVMFNSSHTYPLTIEDYIENVVALEHNRPLRTLYAEIRPTTVCDHSCKGCFSEEFRRKRADLNPDRLMRLIGELNELNVGLVRFSGGGDPLLYKGIEAAVEKASSTGMGTVLITNGSILHTKELSRFVDHLNLLRVSINGGTESHSVIHGCPKESYGRIVQSLEVISTIRARKKAERKLYLGVTYLIFPENVHEMRATAQMLKNAGVDGIYFRAPNSHEQFTPAILQRLMQEADASRALTDDTFFVHVAKRLFDANANPSVNKTYCYSAQFRLYIEADGQVTGCGRWSGTKEFQFGNINQQDLRTILEKSTMLQKIKNTHLMRCRGCDCAYFNEAMRFIHDEYKTEPAVRFSKGPRGEHNGR